MKETLSVGLSLAGRRETLERPQDLGAWGISSLRIPVPLPLKPQDAAAVESAHAAGCFIMAVLKFSPADVQWPHALTQVLQRLPFVTHWEIESEPDDPIFGWPSDQLATYAACLSKAAALIKGINPQAQIHNGGLGRSLPKGIARLCALGAGASVDIWNVHPYMNPLMPDAKGCLRYFQELIRRTLIQEGQAAKPVWWSSIACPGMRDPKLAVDWWLGKNPTEAMQAEWLKIVYAAAAQAGVERIFWEGWQDRPSQTPTGIDYFGLRRTDNSVKPVLEVLAASIKIGL
jgi:hypothetical protein